MTDFPPNYDTQLIDNRDSHNYIHAQRHTSQNQQNGFARRLPTMADTRQSSRRSAQE